MGVSVGDPVAQPAQPQSAPRAQPEMARAAGGTAGWATGDWGTGGFGAGAGARLQICGGTHERGELSISLELGSPVAGLHNLSQPGHERGGVSTVDSPVVPRHDQVADRMDGDTVGAVRQI